MVNITPRPLYLRKGMGPRNGTDILNRNIFSYLPGLEPLTVQKVSLVTIPTTVYRLQRRVQNSTNPMTKHDSDTLVTIRAGKTCTKKKNGHVMRRSRPSVCFISKTKGFRLNLVFGVYTKCGRGEVLLILRCVIPVVCRKTNGEVNFSHETQLWWYVF